MGMVGSASRRSSGRKTPVFRGGSRKQRGARCGLHVARRKHGLSTTHPLRGDELRAIKTWLAERVRMKPETDAFFVSERRSPLSRKTAWLMIRDYGRLAGLSVEAHPHMLRHACGFALADQGADTRLIQDYLGHRNIQHTVRYTATNPARFERLWR